jgi:hypothetical protein
MFATVRGSECISVNGARLFPRARLWNASLPVLLSAGGHHFRIRQVSGSFFFLSLTVYRF